MSLIAVHAAPVRAINEQWLERHGALERNELGGYKFTQPGLHQPLPAVTA